MNLKEAFRYQKFLDVMMMSANTMLSNPDVCLSTTENHLRKAYNADAEDTVETVENEEYVHPDILVRFMTHMVEQRQTLSEAIAEAKRNLPFDLDAAIETNKFRQTMHKTLKRMMQYKAGKTRRQGYDYKFDINGAQVRYQYNIEVERTEKYNRNASKRLAQEVIAAADAESARIDEAMIVCAVKYEPPYNVNDNFNDVIEQFIANVVDAVKV